MGVRRAVAVACLATLLAGCGSGAVTTAAPRPRTPAGTRSGPVPRPDRATPAQAAGHHRRGRLALLPTGCTPGQLRLGPATPDGGGGEGDDVWTVHLVNGPPCTLWGTPSVRFLGVGGSALPFALTRHWLGGELRGPVLVDARHSPAFPVAKYRCDTSRDAPVARAVVATLPLGAGRLVGRIPVGSERLAFCPGDEGDQRVHVGAIGSWQLTRRAPPRRVAISMHSSFGPAGRPTWGRGDLDGDGRRDLVVFRPSGLLTARIGSRTHRLRLPPDPTGRLQGLADLTGDGRPDILIGGTALGCDAGYRLCATSTTVVTLARHRLRVVGFPRSRPQWNDGQGDLFSGWTCGAGGLTGLEALQTGGSSYRLTRTAYVVRGLRATVVGRTTSRGTSSFEGLARLTRTRCAGLDRWGWAPERGPLG